MSQSRWVLVFVVVLAGLSNGGVGAYTIGMRHAWRFSHVQAMAGAPSWLQYLGRTSETDRRVVRISLTPEGQAVAERVPEVLCAVYNRALQGFTADEWAQLRSLLLRLAERAEAMAQEPGAPA